MNASFPPSLFLPATRRRFLQSAAVATFSVVFADFSTAVAAKSSTPDFERVPYYWPAKNSPPVSASTQAPNAPTVTFAPFISIGSRVAPTAAESRLTFSKPFATNFAPKRARNASSFVTSTSKRRKIGDLRRPS